jgi:serine protease Do
MRYEKFKHTGGDSVPEIVQQINFEMAAMMDRLTQGVVQIVDERGSLGAGTIWHNDGLILTNAHVVARRTPYVVLPDGDVFEAEILAYDRQNDLAALVIEADNLPTITLGDSRALKPGQWVVAMGHPHGVINAITAGVVIGIGANLPEMQPGRDWIALNLRLRPGHSGGPLVNAAGHLVGINTMISGPSVGFAVPVHVIKRFLKENLGTPVTEAVAGTVV